MEPQETMSTEQAAKILQCSENHVNWLCRQEKKKPGTGLKAEKPFGRWIVNAHDVRVKAGLELGEDTHAVEPTKDNFDIYPVFQRRSYNGFYRCGRYFACATR